jgi:hydrogenase small subunit
MSVEKERANTIGGGSDVAVADENPRTASTAHPMLDLPAELARRGVSRRDFLKYCTMMAATLALPTDQISRIAHALEAVQRPAAIYLEFQDCAGCTEAFLRASHPSVSQIILDKISLNYQETIMAAAGTQAEAAAQETIAAGNYLLMVEGSISTKDQGVYCCVAGRSALDLLAEAAKNASAIVAVGSCAAFGNIPAAYPNPTGAVGVSNLVSHVPIVNMSGCPVNAVNLAAIVTYYVTYRSLPQLDQLGRPLFAYGTRIHDACERRAHFDAGQYVEHWGDEGHREGWCLYKMGCKGPATFHNCPAVRYNERTSWPVLAGHGCIGCSQPKFWDQMTPFYERLPDVKGFGVEFNVDRIAEILAAVSVFAVAAHAVGSVVRRRSKPESPPPVDENPEAEENTEMDENQEEPK